MKTNRRRVSGGRGSLWTNKAQRALYVLQGQRRRRRRRRTARCIVARSPSLTSGPNNNRPNSLPLLAVVASSQTLSLSLSLSLSLCVPIIAAIVTAHPSPRFDSHPSPRSFQPNPGLPSTWPHFQPLEYGPHRFGHGRLYTVRQKRTLFFCE